MLVLNIFSYLNKWWYGTPRNSLRVFKSTTERTTPSSLAFLDEFSLAGNVSFVDDDLDRHEHLGNALTKTKVFWGRGKVVERNTGRWASLYMGDWIIIIPISGVISPYL